MMGWLGDGRRGPGLGDLQQSSTWASATVPALPGLTSGLRQAIRATLASAIIAVSTLQVTHTLEAAPLHTVPTATSVLAAQ